MVYFPFKEYGIPGKKTIFFSMPVGLSVGANAIDSFARRLAKESILCAEFENAHSVSAKHVHLALAMLGMRKEKTNISPV